jgi:hypothetical protein
VGVNNSLFSMLIAIFSEPNPSKKIKSLSESKLYELAVCTDGKHLLNAISNEDVCSS